MRKDAFEIAAAHAEASLARRVDVASGVPVLETSTGSFPKNVEALTVANLKQRIAILTQVRSRLLDGITALGGCTVLTEVVRNSAIPDTWLAQILSIFLLNVLLPTYVCGIAWYRRDAREALANKTAEAQPALESKPQPRALAPSPALVSPGLAEVSSDAGAESHPGRMTGDELAEALAEHMKRTTEAEIAAAQLRATPLGETNNSK